MRFWVAQRFSAAMITLQTTSGFSRRGTSGAKAPFYLIFRSQASKACATQKLNLGHLSLPARVNSCPSRLWRGEQPRFFTYGTCCRW
jgi:hypothetical protein